MKRILVCDSGLGGLNIASHFFRPKQGGEPCELLYFNAYPAPGAGFNKLPDERAREDLFQEVLKSMEKFSPDCCLVACNTLSIVYESLRKRYTPPFPVEVIVENAVEGMEEALRRDAESSLLILGTLTTVRSGLYRARLLERGIDPARIRSLACPGLATLLEQDPASDEVREKLRCYAGEARALWNTPPRKLLLALCCTHFEFASSLWRDVFTRCFGSPVEIVNPNDSMGKGYSARSFRYLSRIGFVPGAREKMTRYFETRVPEIASALAEAEGDPGLFAFDEKTGKG